MGQGEYLSTYAWGRLLSNLLEHDLVAFLSRVDVKTLSEAEARTVLHEQFRSFMRLKSTLKSSEPRSDVLRPAHEALLNFGARLFMAAHQALLNDARAEPEEHSIVSDNPKWQHAAPAPSTRSLSAGKLLMLARQVLPTSRVAEVGKQSTAIEQVKGEHRVAVPSRQFLLEWQLVRLKVARERLILELADLSERHGNAFLELSLSEVVDAEVESARLRVSSVWKMIPTTASTPAVPPQAREYADGSS